MSEIQSKENLPNLKKMDTQTVEVTEQEVRKVVKQEIQAIEFRGPIPHPDIIGGYEEILPGAADRILSMAEAESKHRRDMERKMIESEARDSLLGILCGFLLGIGCIIAAIIMAIVYPKSIGVVAGAVLGVTGVGSIAGIAIKSTRHNNKDEIEKNTKE